MQGISPALLNEVFVPRQCNYELRGNKFLERIRVTSVIYGTESISSLALKISEILPNEIKDSDTPNFKAKIKKWVPVECPCRLCKIYLPQAGFILEVETTLAFHFQCKTLFTIMIYIDTIMTKCNSSSQL